MSRIARAKRVFNEALDLPEGERAAFVERECAGAASFSCESACPRMPGRTSSMSRPSADAAGRPVIRSASGLNDVMRPSRSLVNKPLIRLSTVCWWSRAIMHGTLVRC